LRAAGACARLAELHLDAGDPRAAVEVARRGVEIDPFADPLWRALVSGYARTGDAAAAARARREYAEVLAELGVPAARRPEPHSGPRRPEPEPPRPADPARTSGTLVP
jgi:DNA-binding SARP family transcriptional activator